MRTALDGLKDESKATDTNAATNEYRERLELLYEVVEKASSIEEVSRLLEDILSIIQRILHASAASFFLVDPEKQELYVPAAGGDVANALRQARIDFSSGVVGWVANHGSPLMVSDVAKDSRFSRDIDKATGFVTKSILAVPLVRGRRVIGVLELVNKADGSPFNDQDLRVLTGLVSTEGLILLVSMATTAITNIKQSRETIESCKNTVETLVTAADARDPYASGHSQRVKKYSLLAARSLSLSTEELQIIEFGALLHDIGKIGISESILRKSGPPLAEEWYMIRKHPMRGANIVSQIPYLERAKEIVLYHHERYDGTGYPEGLKGEGIPLGARLVAVADAFDTMTTDHSYRTALSEEQALVELKEGKGKQFCPKAVDAFISGVRQLKYPEIDKEEITILETTRTVPSQEAKADIAHTSPAISTGASETTESLSVDDTAKAVVELIKREVEPPKYTVEPERPEVVAREEPTGTSHATGPLYEGEVQLLVPSPIHFEQVRIFQENLATITDLRIQTVGGSADEGVLIAVFAQTPLALEQILSEIPNVEKVERAVKKGKQRLAVSLRDSIDEYP